VKPPAKVPSFLSLAAGSAAINYGWFQTRQVWQMSNKIEVITRVSSLAAVGVTLYFIESLVPYPAPFFRVGLANSVTLLALVFLGMREALWVVLLRLVVGSFITGRFLGPTFLLSATGALAALVVMWLFLPTLDKVFSPIGLSILGALAFNVCQLLTGSLVFLRNASLLNLLPLFTILSVAGGTITGILVHLARPYLADTLVARERCN